MSKFVSRAAFVGASGYPGATAQTQRGQLWDALKARLGLTDVNRTTVTATGTLTLNQCGPLQVDASAGDVVLTLPASGAAADEAVYEIDRIDSTAYTVTIAAAGADTIDGAASVQVQGTMTLRLPAGSTVWRVHGISGATPAKARAALGTLSAAEIQAAATGAYAFDKYDSTAPIFIKTGAGTLSVKSYSIVRARNATIIVGALSQAVVMPALTAGADYAIYACDDLTFRADASFAAPTGYTTANSRLIGGFHYGLVAPGTTVAGGSFNTAGTVQTGGMVWTQGDVDNIAGINLYTLWDLKWRANVNDLRAQRGFFYHHGGAWSGLYFASTDCDANGLSKYNTDVASGTVLPKIPATMGGNGTLTYADFNWWRASELARAYGARLMTEAEFNIAAFGVTENQSLGGAASTIPLTTRQAGFTSKYGGEQYTGHHWIWGDDSSGTTPSAYVANGGRGQSYANSTTKVILGGARVNAANSGSRTSYWNNVPTYSGWDIGLRAACDHLMLA